MGWTASCPFHAVGAILEVEWADPEDAGYCSEHAGTASNPAVFPIDYLGELVAMIQRGSS